jgi:hypothetical protein
LPPTQEDYRIRFYEMYRRESEEYDRELIWKYGEDLNSALIFVGLSVLLACRCADSAHRLVCSPQ